MGVAPGLLISSRSAPSGGAVWRHIGWALSDQGTCAASRLSRLALPPSPCGLKPEMLPCQGPPDVSESSRPASSLSRRLLMRLRRRTAIATAAKEERSTAAAAPP